MCGWGVLPGHRLARPLRSSYKLVLLMHTTGWLGRSGRVGASARSAGWPARFAGGAADGAAPPPAAAACSRGRRRQQPVAQAGRVRGVLCGRSPRHLDTFIMIMTMLTTMMTMVVVVHTKGEIHVHILRIECPNIDHVMLAPCHVRAVCSRSVVPCHVRAMPCQCRMFVLCHVRRTVT